MKVLYDHAAALGLDALVEVHDATELAIAVDAGAKAIGVNNRNLRTLVVDPATSDELIAVMPPHVVAVSESGLKTGGDVMSLRERGYRAFLIGERFMTSVEPGRALHMLLAECGSDVETSASRGGSVRGERP